MQAIMITRKGGPEVLELREVPTPVARPEEVPAQRHETEREVLVQGAGTGEVGAGARDRVHAHGRAVLGAARRMLQPPRLKPRCNFTAIFLLMVW